MTEQKALEMVLAFLLDQAEHETPTKTSLHEQETKTQRP